MKNVIYIYVKVRKLSAKKKKYRYTIKIVLSPMYISKYNHKYYQTTWTIRILLCLFFSANKRNSCVKHVFFCDKPLPWQWYPILMSIIGGIFENYWDFHENCCMKNIWLVGFELAGNASAVPKIFHIAVQLSKCPFLKLLGTTASHVRL